jgi:hypothetical protein
MIQSSYTPVKPKNYQPNALTKPNKRYLDSENHRGFRQNRINYRGKALKIAKNAEIARKAREIQKQINQSAKAVEKPATAPIPERTNIIGKAFNFFTTRVKHKGLIALYGFFFLSQF